MDIDGRSKFDFNFFYKKFSYVQFFFDLKKLAHCLIGGRPGNIVAVVGLVKVNEGTHYEISQVIRHPWYIPNIVGVYTSNWHE
jgi:hypothetical protein